MTTITKPACEPIMIDPMKLMNNFAEWKHPKNENAQYVCKYNTMAMFANTLLVSTIVNVAIACFSNFIVLGIVLTATTGFLFLWASHTAEEMVSDIDFPKDSTWKPTLIVVQLGRETMPLILRCYSIPKADAAPASAEGQEATAPCDQEMSFQPRRDFDEKSARV